MRTTFIYALIDPRNGNVRYIGQAVNLQARLAGHCTYSTSRKTRAWIKQLSLLNLKPLIKQLDQACINCAVEVEQKWMDFHKSSKLLNKVRASKVHRLFNLTPTELRNIGYKT